ncbi:hypothetical protein [Paraburkholderia sp.]|uniref:hypothetical protein n=1 Tax=Paraburkholderia sp. TaxID=1926495 RepID=UPI002D680AA8|nr:hypothetical protein [Paraburkholderia sp.]HZZ06873.1 hypothetical protein [Paraburkholderia sp.]
MQRSIAALLLAKQLIGKRSFRFPLKHSENTMTKRKPDQTVLPGQLPLAFDVFAIDTPHGLVAAAGENELDAGIRQAVNGLLERCVAKGLSRERVADRLTESLARPVSKAHLDQWVAPSQADRRIPVDVWIALMKISEDFVPLEWMAMHMGRRVLTVDEALCAELGAMAVIDRHLKARSRAIEGQMDEKLLSQLMNRIKRNTK